MTKVAALLMYLCVGLLEYLFTVGHVLEASEIEEKMPQEGPMGKDIKALFVKHPHVIMLIMIVCWPLTILEFVVRARATIGAAVRQKLYMRWIRRRRK